MFDIVLVAGASVAMVTLLVVQSLLEDVIRFDPRRCAGEPSRPTSASSTAGT